MSTAQRVLFTLAGAISVGLAIYSFVSGEFAEVSIVRKSFRILFALVGVVYLWKAWGSSPRAADPRR